MRDRAQEMQDMADDQIGTLKTDSSCKRSSIEDEVSGIMAELARAAPLYAGKEPDVAALLQDRDGCLVAASIALSKHEPELSCARGFALLATEIGLREAVSAGLRGLLLEGSFLGKREIHGGEGRSRVEVLARALQLLLTDRPQCERACLMFSMADLNKSGAIQKQELHRMLESHVSMVGAAVPWLMHQSLRNSPDNRGLEDRMQAVIADLKQEIAAEVPAAVEQIFSETDTDFNSVLTEREWKAAWRSHPELMDLLNLEGMHRMVCWAAAASKQQQSISQSSGSEGVQTS